MAMSKRELNFMIFNDNQVECIIGNDKRDKEEGKECVPQEKKHTRNVFEKCRH